METLNAATLTKTENAVRCDCGFDIPILPPDKTWRKVLCICEQLWWVKPSGRRFVKHTVQEDLEYNG